MSNRPRRSMLYMPGANERALEKAASLDVDTLIFDLEDAVAPEAKVGARDNIALAFSKHEYGHRETIIRINGLDTQWGEEDLHFVASTKANGILVPKVNTGADIYAIHEKLKAAGNDHLSLWVMMETPLAMLNAKEIAETAQETPLCGFVMGTNDLAKETGASFADERAVFVPWLMHCLTAARAYGLDIIDGVYNDFNNIDGFISECTQGKRMGMDGKTLIHPKQIEKCNAIFSPSPEEITAAREIIAAFALEENAGKGAIKISGKMVERLHCDMATQLVAKAEQIENR